MNAQIAHQCKLSNFPFLCANCALRCPNHITEFSVQQYLYYVLLENVSVKVLLVIPSLLSPRLSRHPVSPLTLSLPSHLLSPHPVSPVTPSFPSPRLSCHPIFPLTPSLPSPCLSPHPVSPLTLLSPHPFSPLTPSLP